jgi:hypothetical protein
MTGEEGMRATDTSTMSGTTLQPGQVWYQHNDQAAREERRRIAQHELVIDQIVDAISDPALAEKVATLKAMLRK